MVGTGCLPTLALTAGQGHPSEMASSFPSHFQTQKRLLGLNTADHENSFSLLTFLKHEGFKEKQQKSVSLLLFPALIVNKTRG